MNLTSEATQVFLKEFRSLGRDKHTLTASILVPLFLYPALVWGTLQILLYARGLEDRTESRVLVLGGTPGDDLWDFYYYSFVTLTTVGYGDILAMTKPARSLSILEALTGQLYLALMISRLVGLHTSQSGIGKGK